MSIEELLAQQEGKTLEFKQDLSSHKNIIKTITAFANTAGGTLLIGVKDDNKAVLGLESPLEDEERLASIIADSVEPRLVPSIDIINWQGRNLLVVEIYPSPLRPHHVKEMGPENGTLVRIGSTNRQADSPLRKELARWVEYRSFDEEPMPEINPEAIDFRVASGLFSGLREWSENKMESLRLVTRCQGKFTPTIGGVLNEKDQKIVALIKESAEEGGATPKYLSEKIGMTTRAMSTRLHKLVDAGYIVAVQKNPYDPNKKYLPVKQD